MLDNSIAHKHSFRLRLNRSWAGVLWRNREVTLALAKREITDRFAGQALGVIWTFAHPLILILIYITVFAYVLKLKTGLDTGGTFLVYMLSGLLPWMTVQDAMMRSATIILAHGSMVKQVAFPLVVLPFKTVLAAFLNQVISTTLFMGYILWTGEGIPWTLALWLPLFVIQFAGLLGLGYILACVGVFMRDLKDVLQVLCTGGLFCLPIFYRLEQLPSWVQGIVVLNPFTHLVFCYQDIFFYQTIAHPAAWLGVTVCSGILLFAGATLFNHMKNLFGNVL